VQTTTGTVVAQAGGWTIGAVHLTTGDLGPIARKDYDRDGETEPVAAELDGMAKKRASATVRYYAEPDVKVVGFSAS
jgi:hypothetical protein